MQGSTGVGTTNSTTVEPSVEPQNGTTENNSLSVDYKGKSHFSRDAVDTIDSTIDSTTVEPQNGTGKERNTKNTKNIISSSGIANAIPDQDGDSHLQVDIEDLVKEKKPRRRFKFDDDQMKIANWMFERIKKVIPAIKKPNLESWANDVRLMHEVDERGYQIICAVFSWSNRDSFWSTNILSPSKFRKQFPVLHAKSMIQAEKPKPEKSLMEKTKDRSWAEHLVDFSTESPEQEYLDLGPLPEIDTQS